MKMPVEFPFKIADKKRKPGLKAKAPITKVQQVKAVEIFKEKAKDPAQPVYAVYARLEGRDIRVAVFNKPQGEEISPKSKLARFKLRYKRFPAVGMKVGLVTDDNGFWKIDLG